MRKRLALAAALLNDPPLLILDEIAANLDAEGRHSFLQLLGHLKQQGKAILFTSHRLDEVEMLADRVLVLERGTLKHDCAPRELGPTLGIHCEVTLFVPEKLVEPALGILHTGGFSAQRNGRGISVRVEPHLPSQLSGGRVAILVWFVLVYLTHLGVMGGTLAFHLQVRNLFRISLLNPMQVFKMSVLGSIHASLDVLGPAGLYATRTYGARLVLLFVGAGAVWVIAPLGVAGALFVRRSEA